MASEPADLIESILGTRATTVRPVAGGDVCQSFRADVDGHAVFIKTHDAPHDELFASEARGLRWLAAAEGGPPVPAVLGVEPSGLILQWVEEDSASGDAAERFGRRLAAMHRAGADAFGASWPGFIGPLPMSNAITDDWPGFFGQQRVLPFARQAMERGAIDAGGMAQIEQLVDRLPRVAGAAEAPSRIHGDLWSGNLMWAADGDVWLVDPAAHGGHRETDLGMLALFGAPHLDRIVGAYDEVDPLADGWRERVSLHQLHPLLVHAVLFGGHYGARAVEVAHRYA